MNAMHVSLMHAAAFHTQKSSSRKGMQKKWTRHKIGLLYIKEFFSIVNLIKHTNLTKLA